jgi:hypothetical protein
MGMNFVTLMKYAGPDENVIRIVDALAEKSPDDVRALAGLFRERGFPDLGQGTCSQWEDLFEEKPYDCRPSLPNMRISLGTPEDFFLTFGRDIVQVWHLLRWIYFLTDPILQPAMIDACRCLARLFAATDCIITSDYSPVVAAFVDGQDFDSVLLAGTGEDGERESVADLYVEWPEDYVIRRDQSERLRDFHVPGLELKDAEYKDWDIAKPPPPGWERATTWGSKGYWRLRLNPPAIQGSWLSWNDGTVLKLAKDVAEKHDFGLLPVLGDALEEAGCDNEEILTHCRSQSPHERGCWVADLLLANT